MGLTLNWKLLQSFLGEYAVSFLFGFIVYSASVSATLTNQVAGPIAVGLAVALGSIAIIYAFCEITIAHFNPAITFAAMFYFKLPIISGIVYIIAQGLGFMTAAAVILGCYPTSSNNKLQIIRPKKVSDDVTRGNIIATEMFLTGILVFVAFSVAINVFKKAKFQESKDNPAGQESEDTTPDHTILAPLVIGLTLGFLAFLGYSSSGGVFNPGLVWAPVLFTGDWYNSWCYWVGQFGGAIVGGGIQVFLLARMY